MSNRLLVQGRRAAVFDTEQLLRLLSEPREVCVAPRASVLLDPDLLEAGSSVTGSYQTTATDTSAQTTYSFTSQAFGTAATGRIIAVAVRWRNGASDRSISSATIGGIAANVTNYVHGVPGGVGIIWAVVPTGTTGTVAITFSGNNANCAISIYSIYGAASSTPAYASSAFGSGTAATTSLTPSYSGSAFVVANGVAMAASLTTTWSGGVAEDDDASVSDAGSSFSYSTANALMSAAAITATLSSTTTDSQRGLAVAAWQ